MTRLATTVASAMSTEFTSDSIAFPCGRKTRSQNENPHSTGSLWGKYQASVTAQRSMLAMGPKMANARRPRTTARKTVASEARAFTPSGLPRGSRDGDRSTR